MSSGRLTIVRFARSIQVAEHDGVAGKVGSLFDGSGTLTGISGSAVAHALNGRVKVVFTSVDSQKPMSFSSMNGKIDLTFPASLKANAKLKNQKGPEIQNSNFNGSILIRKSGQ